MSSPAERAKKALVGALLADAATAGVHWIYLQDDVIRAVNREPAPKEEEAPSREAVFAKMNAQKEAWAKDPKCKPALDLQNLAPEFLDPSACPWYQSSPGELSPYGQESLSLLRSLVKEGELVPESYAADAVAEIAASNGYVAHLSKTFRAAWDAGKRGKDASAAVLAEAASTGNAFDTHAHSIVRVPPLAARYFGDLSVLLAKVEEAVRVMQDNDVAVQQAIGFAFILHKVIHGTSLKDAVVAAADPTSGLSDGARETAKTALETSGSLDPRHIGCKLGLSCSLPEMFAVSLAIALAHPTSYRDAVRENALVGGARGPCAALRDGDNCSRAVAVGALVAAAGGDIAELGEASLAKAAAVIAEATQAGDTLAARA